MYKPDKVKKELINKPGESYQHFLPYQQGDFDEKMRYLAWWQWPLFIVVFIGLMIFFTSHKLYEWIRYRGKGDFVPGSAKHDYRIKPEQLAEKPVGEPKDLFEESNGW